MSKPSGVGRQREPRLFPDEAAAAHGPQGTLVGAEPQPLPALSDTEGDGAGLTCEPAGSFGQDRQRDLFASRAVLSREVEHALVDGRFDEVSRLRPRIEDEYGRCAETGDLGFADRLEFALRQGSPAVALATWAELDHALAGAGALRTRVRDGVFARLLGSHSPAVLVEAWAPCLPATTHLLARTKNADGRRHGRLLVRDALLASRILEPLDSRHDPPVADLLAEDRAPPWLACLGAIRRLWPARPAEPERPANWSRRRPHLAAPGPAERGPPGVAGIRLTRNPRRSSRPRPSFAISRPHRANGGARRPPSHAGPPR